MKRLLVAIATLLFFGGGVLALIWFGNYFAFYTSSQQGLRVEKSTPQILPLGSQAVMDLHGSGFNQETSVSLFMDVSSGEAVIGSFPMEGIYNASLFYDDFLYLASDERGVQVLDVKNPRQPQLLKEYLVGRSIIDIQRSGNYLYFASGQLGVSIMRIQQGGLLEHVTDISIGSTAIKCQVSHGFMFVAASGDGLLIYDVRQPEQVKLVKVLRSDSFISNVVVSGNFLYLPVSGNQVEIYRLAELQMPSLVEPLKLSEIIYDLIVHRQHLYIATESGVSMYDMANGSRPEFLQKWTDFGSAKKLFMGQNHIYVSDSYSGLRVIAPELSTSTDYINLNIDPRTIAAAPGYLFVAGSNQGLLIVDKVTLLKPQVVEIINTPGSARDLFIKNNWMYIADARSGVFLQNLKAEVDTITAITSRWGESFLVHRELLFVAQAKMGIEVFDISDPGKPESVVIWPELQAMRLAAAGDYLFLSKGVFGVELVDISDIHHPVIKDTLPDIHALDITSDGNLIYIASKNKGLLVYEVTDNNKLSRLSSLLTPFPMNHFDLAVAVQVQNEIAYVANGGSGLLIIDVRKPTEPIILSSIDIPGTCKGVKVVDNKAFISSHHGGISVVDIKDPENPALLNSISMPGLSRGLQVVDDLIYVAQKEVGVTAIPVPVMAKSIDVLSNEQMQVILPSPKFPGSYNLQISNQRELVVSDGAFQYR